MTICIINQLSQIISNIDDLFVLGDILCLKLEKVNVLYTTLRYNNGRKFLIKASVLPLDCSEWPSSLNDYHVTPRTQQHYSIYVWIIDLGSYQSHLESFRIICTVQLFNVPEKSSQELPLFLEIMSCFLEFGHLKPNETVKSSIVTLYMTFERILKDISMSYLAKS